MRLVVVPAVLQSFDGAINIGTVDLKTTNTGDSGDGVPESKFVVSNV